MIYIVFVLVYIISLMWGITGFTIMFGSLLLKNYRIYSLFSQASKATKLKFVMLTDPQLAAVI